MADRKRAAPTAAQVAEPKAPRKRGKPPQQRKLLAEFERQERREHIARLYATKMTQVEIAAQLGISQALVSLEINAVLAEWRERAALAIAERKAQELAELEVMERRAVAIAQSVGDDRATRGERLYAERTRLAIKQRIHALLGLDAPKAVTLTAAPGSSPYEQLQADERARLWEMAVQAEVQRRLRQSGAVEAKARLLPPGD